MTRYRDTSNERYRDSDGIVHRYAMFYNGDVDGEGHMDHDEETFCHRNIWASYRGGEFLGGDLEELPPVTCLQCLVRQ